MKKRRIITAVLAGIMALTSFSCSFAAETGADAPVTSTAPAAEETGGENLSLNIVEYHDGIVNGYDTAFLEETEKDGKPVLKVVPNPATAVPTKSLSIDGYSYQTAKIDLTKFKWAAIEYYYDSPNPRDEQIILGVMASKVLSKSQYAYSREKLVSGTWAIATFDISSVQSVLLPDLTSYNAKQLHIQVFSKSKAGELSADDIMYFGRLMFFEHEPDFTSHNSYMNGYTDGTFLPGGTMTRAEACTVISRLLEAEENIAGTSAFADVPADAWFAKYIGFCEAKGLLASYSGNFLPNQPITRAEFSELVYLTGLAQDKGIAASFTDVAESHPRYASIMAAAKAGLIKGYDDGNGTFSFKPDNTITRAEVVTVINRARGTSKKTENLTRNTVKLFSDVDESHWAFADIAEATVPHVESKGSWVYTLVDPVAILAEKIGMDAVYNLAAGNAKVAELDALEAKRIEEIRNTPNMDLSRITGKKIYVSESLGDNKNDGLTEATPVKTAEQANKLVDKGGAVLFKRGDLWREQFEAREGVTYTAYGEGAKPVFYGSPRNGAVAEDWSLVHEDKETGALIWMYKDQNMLDVGSLILNEGEGFAVKEFPSCIGSEYVVRGTTTPYDFKKELDNNFEFFHCANSVSGDYIIPGSAVGPLYFRCDNGNPGKVFDSIEFVAYGAGIAVGTSNDVVIDNLCIKYTSFGISASSGVKNLNISNMEIGWIGGNVQTYNYANSGGRCTRYGNGIEVYGACDGFYIDNCYIYQCYDAGVTHQSKESLDGKTPIFEDNVAYTNNVLTDCVYNIEYFLGYTPGDVATESGGKNILFEGNLCRRAGYGFGSMRPDAENQRHIRGGSGNNFENFVIKNNIFDRAVHELAKTTIDAAVAKTGTKAPVYDSNVYIQGVGNGLYNHDVDKAAKTDLIAARLIREELGDKNAQFYFVDYIPKYTYSYTNAKTAPVTDEDRRVFEITKPEVSAEEGESTVVSAPLHIEVQKEKNIYREVRASTTLEAKTDEATGIVYNEVTVLNEAKVLMLDCYGITPAIPVENGYVYVKILMRTNQKVKPQVFVYGMKNENGEKAPGSPNGFAVTATEGNGEWEEVIVKITNIPADAVTSSQLHINYAGQLQGKDLYKDGVCNAKFDIAAWAVFENLASAKAFDLIAAAK